MGRRGPWCHCGHSQASHDLAKILDDPSSCSGWQPAGDTWAGKTELGEVDLPAIGEAEGYTVTAMDCACDDFRTGPP